jgi:hypothetical protein
MITETIMIAAAAGVPCAIAGFALGRLTGLAGLRNELNALDAENQQWALEEVKRQAQRKAAAIEAGKRSRADAVARAAERAKKAEALHGDMRAQIGAAA